MLKSLSVKRQKTDQYNSLLDIVKRDRNVEHLFVVMKGLMVLENVLRLCVKKEITKLHGTIFKYNRRPTNVSKEKLENYWKNIFNKYLRKDSENNRLNVNNSILEFICDEPAEVAKVYIHMSIKSQEQRIQERNKENKRYGFDNMDVSALIQIMKNCQIFEKLPSKELQNIYDLRNQTHHATNNENTKFNEDDKNDAFEKMQTMMKLIQEFDQNLPNETEEAYGYDPQEELQKVKELNAATITSALCQDVVFMEDRIDDLEEVSKDHETRLEKHESDKTKFTKVDEDASTLKTACDNDIIHDSECSSSPSEPSATDLIDLNDNEDEFSVNKKRCCDNSLTLKNDDKFKNNDVLVVDTDRSCGNSQALNNSNVNNTLDCKSQNSDKVLDFKTSKTFKITETSFNNFKQTQPSVIHKLPASFFVIVVILFVVTMIKNYTFMISLFVLFVYNYPFLSILLTSSTLFCIFSNDLIKQLY